MQLSPKRIREAKIDALLVTARQGYVEDDNLAALSSDEQEGLHKRLESCAYELATFSDDLLDRVHQELVVNKTKLGVELINILLDEYNSKTIHDHLVFRPALKNSSAHEARLLIRSLRDHTLLPTVDNYTDCDPLITKQAAAILIVTERLYSHYNESRRVGSPATWVPLLISNGVRLQFPPIIKLVLSTPESADQIADIMISRETTDAQLIKSILNSDSPSLSNGVL